MILSLILACVAAQGTPQDRHKAVLEVLKRRAAEITSESLKGIESRGDWERARPRLRQELLYGLGLDPLPPRDPLEPRVTGRVDRAGYVIEKVVFQSLRGLYVTGNLYLPAGSERRPAILYVCGHSPHPLGAKVYYQDHALAFVRQGYVVLVLDTLEFGEVPGLHHGIHDLNLWNWLSMGYTPAGVEVWNAIRALDYLETRREVDAKKIGMTGISGGGSTTWFTAAVDDRVAAASPVCSTYTFGSQAARWVAAGQCDCIYFLNTFERDFSVVAALIAPRPLLFVSGKKDGDFPPEGYKEVARAAGRIFDLLGSGERMKELDDDVGHTYTPGFRKAIAEWMNRWLKGEEGSVELPKGEESGKEAAEVLACLPAIPDDSINDSVHHRFVGRTAVVGREKILPELKEKTFRGFPRGDLPFETQVGRGTGGWAARYARYKDVTFLSEPGLRVRAQLYRTPGEKKGTRLLVVAKRAGDSIYFLDLDELLPLLGRVDILVLNPRLTEHPVSAFEYAEIERSSAWVGRTIGSMQVWDILRAVDWAIREENLSPESISLFGKGATGILCLYAALLDERVHEVILQDPPSSHRQGPALLNVLRITDIPESAALLAPRRLTILGGVPDAFRGAREAASLREAFRAWER